MSEERDLLRIGLPKGSGLEVNAAGIEMDAGAYGACDCDEWCSDDT